MINAFTPKTVPKTVPKALPKTMHETILSNQVWLGSKRWAGLGSKRWAGLGSRRWAGLGSRRWAGLGKLFCVFWLFIFCLLLPLNSFAKPGALPENNLAGPALGDADFLEEADANSIQHLENPEKPEKAVKHVLSFASLGQNHSLVLDGDSTLWVFGDNHFGQLGLKGQAAVVGPLALLKNVKTLAAGPNHSFAITQDGTLWAFGENGYGQLGNGSLKASSGLLNANDSNDDSRRGQPSLSGYSGYSGYSGSAGSSGTAPPNGVRPNGVPPNGVMPDGVMANGGVTSNFSPVLSRALGVSTSAKHTLAVDETGNVWAFGDNSQGQLGTGNRLSSPSPLKVMSGASAVLAGKDYSLALAREYTLWAWGGNAFGQLGTGSTKNVLHPCPVLSQVMKVAAGNGHVLALRGDDSLWAWGGNKYGEVGDGSSEMRLAPIKIMDNIADVAAGPDYSLALGLDGRLWIWGRLDFTPQAGQISEAAKLAAPKVITKPSLILEDIAQISVAQQCGLALGKNGRLWFFGRLNAPEYGQEAHLPSSGFTPFSPTGPRLLAENVEMAVPGAQHLLFIKQNGSLWGMGNNFSGQTGHKNLELILEPQKVKFKLD